MPHIIKTLLLVVAVICLIVNPVYAQEHHGKVIGITDGDTFTLMTKDHEKLKIRLAEIDTPEKAQPYGKKARQALADLIFQEDVIVIQTTIDRYGRIIGEVYKDQSYINAFMVEIGAAWVYRDYADEDSPLYELEADAKAREIGMWKMPEAQITPPWEWRREQRQKKDSIAQEFPVQQDNGTDFSCGSKKYCKQMSNCAEARFYLMQCGRSRLDGDGDGVPCESICR